MGDDRLHTVLASLLGQPVVSTARIGRGGNSRVLCVLCANGDRYAAKLYHGPRADGLSRLAVEFQGLELLWNHGLRCIPRPIAADQDEQIAVYEYIDGDPIEDHAIGEEEIDELLAFLCKLKNLARTVRGEPIPVAYESCLSIEAVTRNISTKFSRLTRECPDCDALQAFLQTEFMPVLQEQTVRVRDAIGNEAFHAELPMELRTLSPADFGFHNILRRAGTGLVFLDFEYFGWEEPVKMMCDFLLHPAASLRPEIEQYFAWRFIGCFGEDQNLAARFRAVYPLYGLRWCMILLNEFLPEHLERRAHASSQREDVTQVQIRQLAKSRRMLRKVTQEHDCGVCAR